MSNRTREIIISSAILIFLLAIGLTIYPLIAQAYTTHHQSQVQSEYNTAIALEDKTELEAARTAAEAYNDALAHGTATEAFSDTALEAAAQGYDTLLDATGTGIMGYVSIPKINVDLPILHGTDDSTLSRGIGHMLGSSLPVGGESTHCVLTGHSGLASAKLFSDLEQLEIGDVFYLSVLGTQMQYEVDAIHVVEPHDVSLITITPGEDYCTLLTCTPFGVNTHRLLVRGHRVEYVPEATSTEDEAAETGVETGGAVQESVWDAQYKRGLILGGLVAGAVLVLFILCDLCRRSKRRRAYRRRGGRYAKR